MHPQPDQKEPTAVVWRDVFSLGQQLLSTLDLNEQRRMLVDTAARLLNAEVDLWLATDSHALSQPGASEKTYDSASQAPSWAQTVLATNKPDAMFSSSALSSPFSLAIPLIPRGRLLGVLRVVRAPDLPFSPAEVDLSQCLATQAATALEATRQLTVERWRINQLSLVRQVGQQLVDVADIDDLCQRVTALILETFDYYFVALYTTEANMPTLRFRASAGPRRAGITEKMPFPGLRVSLGEGMTGWAAQHGYEVVAPDVTTESRYRHEEALPETRSEAAIPLRIRDRILGVLDVQSNELADFSETDLLVLRALADNTAVAIERTRLYSDVRRRADQLATVARVGRALSSILDEDKLLQEVVTLIRQHFGYPFVHVFTLRSGSQQILYRAGSGHRSRILDADGLAYDITDDQGIIPWAARHGQTLVANDVRTEPRYRPSPLPPSNTLAEMAAPLKFAGQVLGVLDLQSDHLNAFSEDDTSLLGALADSVAIALRNASLYRSERWRRQVTDSLQRVAGLLSAELATDEVLDAILTQVIQTIPCDTAVIWLRRGEEWYLAAGQGPAFSPMQPILCQPASFHGWLDRILRGNKPRLFTGRVLPKPLRKTRQPTADHTAIAAPLLVGDIRMGVLALLSHVPQPYDAEDRSLAGTFASQAAIAIHNAQLYDSAQAQAWLSTVLLQVADALQSLADLERVAGTVVRLTAMLTGVDRCILLLWQESSETFSPAASFGLNAAQERQFRAAAYPLATVLPGSDIFGAQTPIIEQAIDRTDDSSADSFHHLGFEKLTILPLVARGKVLGLIALNHQEPPVPRAEGYEDLLLGTAKGIAYQAAGAIENLQLQAARMEEAYVAAALLQITGIAARLTDLQGILEAIVRATPMLVGASRCAIFLWDTEWDCFRLAASFPGTAADDSGKAPACYAAGDFPLLDRMKNKPEPLLQMRWRSSTREEKAMFPLSLVSRLLDVEGDGAITALPLAVRHELFGVFLIQDYAPHRDTHERRIEILQSIAHQVAVTIQNDRLQRETGSREQLEREMDLAGEIQRAFIPDRMPSAPGWDISAMSRPARHVGGDFYDMLELQENHLGIVVADVADKGLPASLYMALTRALVRATSTENRCPASVLERVNDLLVPDARRGMFVTALYARIDTETGRVLVANAGHLPPLIWRAAGHLLETGSKGGIALGVLENIHLTPHEYCLEPGDQMVLFTDGIIDTMSSSGAFFGIRRLQQAISAAATGSARQLLEGIDAALTAFAGETPPTDDCTIVIVKRNAVERVNPPATASQGRGD